VANTDGNARGVVMNSSYNATSNYIYNSNAELSTGTTLMYTAKTGGDEFAFMAMNSDGAATDQFKFLGGGTGQSNVAWTDNSLDYAEYFESNDGSAIPIGSTVVLDVNKIRQAESGEVPIGVVRPVGVSSAHGDMWNHWQNRYLTDDYGASIMEEYTITEWEDKTLIHEAVEVQDAVYETVTKQRQKIVVSEVEEEVSSTEIVLEDGKYVQKTTTETVTKEVSELQWEDVPLYGEDGEQLMRLVSEAVEAVEAKEEVLDEDGNVVEEAVEAVEVQDAVYEGITHRIPVMEDYEEEVLVSEEVEAKDAVYETEDVWFESDKIPEDKIVPDDASVRGINDQGKQFMRRKENPDYDTDREYSSREFRDEWHIVGLLGQIQITKGQPLADSWIKMKDVSDTVEMYFVK